MAVILTDFTVRWPDLLLGDLFSPRRPPSPSGLASLRSTFISAQRTHCTNPLALLPDPATEVRSSSPSSPGTASSHSPSPCLNQALSARWPTYSCGFVRTFPLIPYYATCADFCSSTHWIGPVQWTAFFPGLSIQPSSYLKSSRAFRPQSEEERKTRQPATVVY